MEVDTETGHVEVLRLVAAHDFGVAINPTNVENQIIGGIMQGGLGHALREDVVLDSSTGVVLNSNWLDYKVNTALDTPPIDPILVETFDPMAPYGIRGGGNPPLIATSPAILSAIRNAIGVDLKEIPVTPDVILKALGKI